MVSFDFDAVVIGSGPAGLTAGSQLSRAGHRTLLLERDVYGGNLQHIDRVKDHPEFRDGISGADLASMLLDRASDAGLVLQQGQVSGVEVFSRSRYVALDDGRGFSCGVVILAGGSRFRPLGLPAEDRLRGRGVIDCTPCDAGFYARKPVVVVGSGEYAVRDALHLAKMGAKVTLLSPDDSVQAPADLMTIVRGARVESIVGDERLERIVASTPRGSVELPAAGVAVRTALEPDSHWLADLFDLDAERRVPVNAQLETDARFVLAAGDLRAGSALTVAGAERDGAAAAARARELLAT
jgi:thioredoxin reductase (NADPH)